jgi:hypothetical protein
MGQMLSGGAASVSSSFVAAREAVQRTLLCVKLPPISIL